jgi:hypothetical protein
MHLHAGWTRGTELDVFGIKFKPKSMSEAPGYEVHRPGIEKGINGPLPLIVDLKIKPFFAGTMISPVAGSV